MRLTDNISQDTNELVDKLFSILDETEKIIVNEKEIKYNIRDRVYFKITPIIPGFGFSKRNINIIFNDESFCWRLVIHYDRPDSLDIDVTIGEGIYEGKIPCTYFKSEEIVKYIQIVKSLFKFYWYQEIPQKIMSEGLYLLRINCTDYYEEYQQKDDHYDANFGYYADLVADGQLSPNDPNYPY